MPRQSKHQGLRPSPPAWGDPAAWAFWRLSLVLREVAEGQALAAEKEKEEPLSGAGARRTGGGGQGGDSP